MNRAAKRFYRTAAVVETADGFSITLDGRPLRTPAGAPLVLPGGAMALAVAEEWLAQEDVIRPDTMPVTQLAATAVDRIGGQRRSVIERLISYAAFDLLCYRADEPEELNALQRASWQPLLDWAAEACGARLAVTTGVIPADQPAEAIDALRAAVEALGDLELTALASGVQASGSLVVGLALVAGRIDADIAFEVSQLDEIYQIERWGDDDEAAERRRRLREEIRAAARFLALARETSK